MNEYYKINYASEAKEWVNAINRNSEDDEKAHMMQDELYLEALRGIADGTCEDPQQVAKETIKAHDIQFDRWYS